MYFVNQLEMKISILTLLKQLVPLMLRGTEQEQLHSL
jgi:hypothetical protein